MADPHSIDIVFGQHLRLERERAEVTQEELASRVANEGISFTQATIWKIESGQRPVRMTEAIVIAKVLNLTSWTMLADPEKQYRAIAALAAANERVTKALAALRGSVAELLEARDAVGPAYRRAIDMTRSLGGPIGEDIPEDLVAVSPLDWSVGYDSPEEIALLARFDYENPSRRSKPGEVIPGEEMAALIELKESLGSAYTALQSNLSTTTPSGTRGRREVVGRPNEQESRNEQHRQA